ncbi:hypothetical protein DPMN_191598 [Dreissena polymorpha]|uniref:Uncharacterized protein n=1 Tax=Dreissena polymorpha TaxID=45954 RepID=A0A9D3Y219_DREPO|nr:hypothetical protein DPMN_191598 [Dreissena polymorpha]
MAEWSKRYTFIPAVSGLSQELTNVIRTNVLTNFHEEINSSLPSSHIFQQTGTIFFHDALKINVTLRVKNAPPSGGNVFLPTATFFKLVQDIIGTNLLTKFHEDRTMNVASRVLTRKNAPPPGSHVFQPIGTIYPTINVASRVLTRKNAPPPVGHVFHPTGTIFKLVQDMIGTNLLIKFHEVLTRKNAPPPGGYCHEDWTINMSFRVLIRKICPAPWPHVFQPTVNIFVLVQDIIGTNLLTKFHDDRKINVASRVLTRKNAPPPGGHVFQPTRTIFELIQDIINKNLLTKFHDNRILNVASRVLTRKNARPPDAHVFQPTGTIF